MNRSRRTLLGLMSTGIGALLAAPSLAAAAPQFASPYTRTASRIVIQTSEHKLYHYHDGELLNVYPVAVGRAGRQWSGDTFVARKVLAPKWAPPPIIRKENPNLPPLVNPGPNNPLGAAVLVLGDGNYGIHGTNKESSIGKDVSYGCIRMFNKDILTLFDAVEIGTPVKVFP